MKALITDFIDRFGGRLAGSEAEKNAQLYLRQLLDEFCDHTDLHTFDKPIRAKFHGLKWISLLYLGALVLALYHTLFSIILGLLTAFLFWGNFVSFRAILKPFYPNITSWNITGTIEPKGEVKQTIAIAGHMDSTREFIWWYRFKQQGIYLNIIGGVLFLTFTLVPLLGLLFCGTSGVTGWVYYLWLFYAVLSPTILSYTFIHGKNVVPGAQDNLSGIVTAFYTVKAFSGKNRLQHTRLKMISFGSEETGLCGSEAYVEAHLKQLQQENLHLVNLDGIMNLKELQVLTNERMAGVRYTESLISELEASFNAKSISFRKNVLNIGGTDGAFFVRNGISATTILGLPTDRLDPTYHTRLDIPEYIEEQAMESVKEVLIDFIEKKERISK